MQCECDCGGWRARPMVKLLHRLLKLAQSVQTGSVHVGWGTVGNTGQWISYQLSIIVIQK